MNAEKNYQIHFRFAPRMVPGRTTPVVDEPNIGAREINGLLAAARRLESRPARFTTSRSGSPTPLIDDWTRHTCDLKLARRVLTKHLDQPHGSL
jgi:hypothetical protein